MQRWNLIQSESAVRANVTEGFWGDTVKVQGLAESHHTCFASHLLMWLLRLLLYTHRGQRQNGCAAKETEKILDRLESAW